MKQIMLFIYIISYCLSFYLCKATICDLKLGLVQVVFRHGSRTPGLSEALHINFTDSTAYNSESGYYQLTNEGKRQGYKLGSLLRGRYDEFLGTYNPKEYQAMTSNTSRTMMSLQLALAALFPPSPKDSWNNKIRWRPVPFQQNSPELDITLLPYTGIKYNDLLYKTLAHSRAFQEKIANYTEFLEKMENNTGYPFKSQFVHHSAMAFNPLKYHKNMNLPLPNWYTNDSISTLTKILKLALNGMSWTPKLTRLNGGTLVRKFIENINKNRKAALPKKIYLYCAHDLTLYGFSKAQYLEPFYLPPHGSALIMEKYTDSKKFEYVRILTWDGVSENFATTRIRNCEEFCPFEEYLKIVEPFIPSDEDLNYLNDVKNNRPLYTMRV